MRRIHGETWSIWSICMEIRWIMSDSPLHTRSIVSNMTIADAAGGAVAGCGLQAVANRINRSSTASTKPGGSVMDAAHTYTNEEKVRRFGRRLKAEAAVLVVSTAPFARGDDGSVRCGHWCLAAVATD